MVSIIIPIYNPGDKLAVCLESIRNQSYQSIEVIMVNDGSKDNSDAVCKKFAESDSRFIYIEQENSGVSIARNNGITHSQGEYICFVDSDDSVEPDYVECMVKTLEESHSDIVIQGLVNVYNGKKCEKKEFPHITIKVNNLDDALFEELFYFCGPYCKLFRADYIRNNNIEFPENLSYGEDFVFYTKYLHLCKYISFLSNTSYNYSVAVNGSLSSKRLQPDKFWTNQVNRRGEYKILRKLYGIEKDFYPTENRIKLVALRGLLSSIKYYQSDLSLYIDKIKFDTEFDFINIRPISLYDKLLLRLIQANNFLTRILLNIIIK